MTDTTPGAGTAPTSSDSTAPTSSDSTAPTSSDSTAPTSSDSTAPITRQDVAKVAKLARLRLTDEELDRFTGQLVAILGHAADIEALDLADVEPMARPIPLSNVLRPDEPGTPLDRDEVLAMAPVVEDCQFRVPPSIGAGS
ncbi:MAG: Asp-tRNA(Asn)/Glu-tRNA(Gln) amidotransferase subunit GatC [Microthrixaceae bacterium]|nr:Asp-tRNA(Asn)/Glu-tRNA(Gln) amidotransferase subunit GatC [Microthrixaceae bacterium]